MKIAYYILALAVLGACGETRDYLEEMNEAPQINFGNNPNAPVLKDSIKISNAVGEKKYSITLRVTDKNNNIGDVEYAQLNGTGKLFQNDEEILSNNVTFEKDSSVLIFDYYPESLGDHEFSIKVRDNFGLSNIAKIQLTAFENLPPKANFTARKIGQRSRYEWKIDASDSFDRDAKYGGMIEEYEFSVLGKIFTLYSHEIYVIFPKTGIYEVGVRVKDNDGKWSEKVSISGLTVD